MKINSVGQNDAISKYIDGINKKTERTAPVVNVTDKLELSEGAQKFSELLKTAKDEMSKLDVKDEQKTKDIIERMKKGTYNVSEGEVAASILRGYAEV
jgi:anti-sigma28 factor (negative regulator of flagellin synthesis)